MIYTYIIQTRKGEYYCGKTNNMERRMKQHIKEKNPHWFGKYNNRKEWNKVIYLEGDFEKQIKRAGVFFIFVMLQFKIKKWRMPAS